MSFLGTTLSFDDATWSRVRRFLARRLPEHLVDDVTQSVACEAWANRASAEGQGFVYGVARNVAYDARQQESRVHVEPLDAAAHLHVADATFVSTQLSEVLSYVERTPRLSQPMKWLVAEHAGDSFEEIATREGLAPAAVRQRVSRLRRELRAVFAVALSLALGVGAWSLVASHPAADAGAMSAARLPLANGTWKVVAVDTRDPRFSVLDGCEVHLDGGHGAVVQHGVTSEFTVEEEQGVRYLRASGRREKVTVSELGELRAEARIAGATLTLVRVR
jgi:RNA polymerase sigma-70 factor (ECF subfamily)